MNKLTVLLVLAVAGAACSKASTPAANRAAPAAQNPAAPVARVGGQVITAGELDTAAKPQLARLEAEHAEHVHDAKSQALDGMIDKRLLDAEAQKQGLTADKLIEREVTAKVPAPSDSEIQMVYDQTKASGRQMPPLPEVKGDIVTFLKERKVEQVRKDYMDKLRAQAKVEVLLPPLMLPKVTVAAEGQVKGDAKAPVTIIEFSDFQCPFCGRAEQTVKQVLDKYQGKVRLFYRDYPLPFHNMAEKASEAAQCAADQGKYWEMHERLFANQSALAVPQLKEHAKGLGLDPSKFEHCLDSGEKAKIVEASKKAGDEAGVNGTPAFFINGRPLSGAQPFEKFKEIIDYELSGG